VQFGSLYQSESSWDSDTLGAIRSIRSSDNLHIPVVTNSRISSAVRKVFMMKKCREWGEMNPPVVAINLEVLQTQRFSDSIIVNEPFVILLEYRFCAIPVTFKNSIEAGFSGLRTPATIIKNDAIV